MWGSIIQIHWMHHRNRATANSLQYKRVAYRRYAPYTFMNITGNIASCFAAVEAVWRVDIRFSHLTSAIWCRNHSWNVCWKLSQCLELQKRKSTKSCRIMGKKRLYCFVNLIAQNVKRRNISNWMSTLVYVHMPGKRGYSLDVRIFKSALIETQFRVLLNTRFRKVKRFISSESTDHVSYDKWRHAHVLYLPNPKHINWLSSDAIEEKSSN